MFEVLNPVLIGVGLEVGLVLASACPKISLRDNASRSDSFSCEISVTVPTLNREIPNLFNMAEPTNAEIQERFESAGGNLESDVLAELQSIMRLHSIDVEELWYKWESYSMKMGSDDLKLNIETARALKKDVQDGLERDSRSKQHLQSNKRAVATPRSAASNGDVFGM